MAERFTAQHVHSHPEPFPSPKQPGNISHICKATVRDTVMGTVSFRTRTEPFHHPKQPGKPSHMGSASWAQWHSGCAPVARLLEAAQQLVQQDPHHPR